MAYGNCRLERASDGHLVGQTGYWEAGRQAVSIHCRPVAPLASMVTMDPDTMRWEAPGPAAVSFVTAPMFLATRTADLRSRRTNGSTPAPSPSLLKERMATPKKVCCVD